MRVFGPRMVEVYGHHNSEEDRRFFIGYTADEPGKEYAAAHVSEAIGPYLTTLWADELKGWVMEFGPPPCLTIDQDDNGAVIVRVADEQRTNPGTFPGTAGVEW